MVRTWAEEKCWIRQKQDVKVGAARKRGIEEDLRGDLWMDGSKEDKGMVGVTVEEAGSKVREK